LLLLTSGFTCQSSTRPKTGYNPVDFTHLNVGQESRYVGFTGVLNRPGVDYTGDELFLTVMEDLGDGVFVMRDSLGEGSQENASFQRPVNTFFLSVADDTLRMWNDQEGPASNFMLPGYSQQEADALPLSSIHENKLVIRGMTARSLPSAFVIGYVEQYRQLNYVYSRLNAYIDNRDMAVDGPGFTVLYSAREGVVRVCTYSPWTGTGFGWDLSHRSGSSFFD